uniref:Pre-mRNA-splicing factor CWC25 homolog n=1 Tax=Acrobeloides nanus TaxID=290746 RepID=A0A914C880_9BILA
MANEDDEKIKWMYEGPKSLVNREDYLTGKKIDKNFELYSDVIVKDKEEDRTNSLARSSISKMGSFSGKKAGGLNIHVVRTEDPLVALKMKEENRKRQLLENPLIKLRMQKLLKQEFKKTVLESEEKHDKKDKKKKKTKSRSDSTSSTEKRHRRHSQSSESSKKPKSDHSHRKRHDSSGSENDRSVKSRRHDSSSLEVPKRRHEQRHDSGSSRSHHRHSSGRDLRMNRSRSRSRSRSREQTRRRRHDTSSSEEDRPTSSTIKQKISESAKKAEPEKRRKLTQEELEARRREMMSNVDWRNQVREENLEKSKEKLKEELETGQVAGFIKPMLNQANESLTMEKRLQVSRQNLQRSHDYMDKSFVSRK